MNRLKDLYTKEIKAKLMKEFGIKNEMAIPKLTKIIINVGIGDLIKNKEGKDKLISDISMIAGQRPSERKAKKSIATFSVREGMIVGLAVTLRGERSYAFFDRFVNIIFPRLRDFRGVKRTSFDNFGNFSVGIVDHTVFPEIDLAKAGQSHGMEVTFVTNANDIKKGEKLLELLGMPFTK